MARKNRRKRIHGSNQDSLDELQEFLHKRQNRMPLSDDRPAAAQRDQRRPRQEAMSHQ